MPIKISFNGDNCPEMPTMVLATKSGSKHGVINNITDVVLTDSMASPAELSFQVHKSLDGNPCALWNELVDFKLIWCKEWDRWFSCEVSLSESGESVKSITAYSLGEYELSQILLFDVEINTEDDIARPDYTAPTIFYDPLHPDSSLLHRILSKAPHYTIGHVDSTIERLQRTFSFSNRSIKDCFDDVAEEIGCLFVYDTSGSSGTLSRSISVYDMEQTCLACGYRGEFTGVCPECGSDNIHDGYGTDTTVFVSTDNLTEEITYKVDAGSVKNCFRLTAGDELMTATVRACNPAGGSYIWYIPDSMREDMSDELRTALGNYDNLNQYWTEEKPYELDSGLVSSYNTLVRKYSPVNDQLTEIVNPVTGYSALMRNYYDVIDFALFLQTTMMPEVRPESKTAASQAALLTRESLSPVAVSKLTESTSQATAESAIKTLVRAIVDTAKYLYTVNTTSWLNPNWTGTITITSRTEDDQGQIDTATTPSISLVFTDDFETYLRQLIDKKMKSKDTENFNISNVLSRSVNELVALLPRYSYDCLSSMANCCQDVLNVVIDVSGNQWADVQEDIYTPYYNKLTAIQSEMDLRAREVAVISDELGMGMQQNIESVRSAVQSALDLEDYLGNTLWTELCAYRREDEYSNQNYISDGLSNAELINNALDFIVKARKEIYKSATLQHTITATLSNLLSIPAFNPIVDNFSIGNWIRVRVDEAVYRLRLLSYTVDFSGFDSIQVEFSDVTQMLDGTSDVQNILSSASSMASTFGFVQKQASSGADSKNILSNWVENGLATTQARIVDTADNQNMVWDERGMLFRRYDPIMDDYDPEQLKIINSTIAITDDSWRSIKTAVGRFYYQDPTTGQYTEAYGVNGETIVGKLILGENLGIYNTSGSLTFDQNGLAVSNSKNSITINPNGSSLFSIKKGQNDVFYFDSDGMLHIVGDGAGLDISGNSGLSNAISDFRDNYIAPLVSGIQTQIDGKIDTWYQEQDPSTSWPSTDYTKHDGDLWYKPSDSTTKRWDGTQWLKQSAPQEVFDAIDGKAQIFITTPSVPYNEGDLWFNSTTSDIMTCVNTRITGSYTASDWQKRNKYTDDSSLTTFITNIYTTDKQSLQSQIDGKIETWCQSADPSTGWDATAKQLHTGDLWYNTSNNTTQRWTGSEWTTQTVPDSVSTLISQKAQIFVAQPAPPYSVGDLWCVDGGDILTCATARATGSYNASDWVKKNKYTDDTALTTFLTNTYATDKQSLQSQIDGKIETWYQSSDPSTAWTTSALQTQHAGDLWYDTTSGGNVTKRWDGSQWVEQSAPKEVFDAIDGKAQIFLQEPTVPYNSGDLWFNSTTSDIMTCVQSRATGSYTASDWQKRNKYTDDSSLTTFISTTYQSAIQSLQSQIDGKIDTWYQEQDPSLSWASADYAEHTGDLWYKPSDSTTKRWDGTQWLEQAAPQEVFDAIDGKAQIFITTPTLPYNKGDLWFNSATSDIMTCINTRTTGSYTASDWQKRNKYTDDSSLTTFISNTYATDKQSLQSQIDGKIETWYQTTDPSSGWDSTAKQNHVGDLWYNTSNNTTQRWTGSEWAAQDVPDAVFDAIDGKSNIFIAQPTVPYNLGDMWFITASDIGSGKAMTEAYATSKGIVAGDILTCTTARSSSQSYSQSDWEKKNGYETASGVNVLIDNKKSSIRLSADALSWTATNSSLTSAGYLTVTGGTIGGFAVDSTAIHTANIAVTSNAQNSVALSSADFTRTINGASRSGLRFAIGSNFGITNNGTMYASGGSFSGDIAATSFTINGNSLASVATTGNYSSLSGCPTPASTYITRIDGNGIKVHAENYTTTNYVQINADGMNVVKSGSTIASFGSTITVGKLYIDSSSLWFRDSSSYFGFKFKYDGSDMVLLLTDSTGEVSGEDDNPYEYIRAQLGSRLGEQRLILRDVQINNTMYIYGTVRLYGNQAISGNSSNIYIGTNAGSAYDPTYVNTYLRGRSVSVYSHGDGVTVGGSSDKVYLTGSVYENGTALSSKYAAYSHSHSGYASSNHTHTTFTSRIYTNGLDVTVTNSDYGGSSSGTSMSLTSFVKNVIKHHVKSSSRQNF